MKMAGSQNLAVVRRDRRFWVIKEGAVDPNGGPNLPNLLSHAEVVVAVFMLVMIKTTLIVRNFE